MKSRKMEIDTSVKIQELENALQSERERLGAIRQSMYRSNEQVPAQQVAAAVGQTAPQQLITPVQMQNIQAPAEATVKPEKPAKPQVPLDLLS